MNNQQIVIIIAAFVMGWFAFGILYNLRRGNALMRWLQQGLPLIGERTTFRWLGSSVAELSIKNAKTPFRRLDIIIMLAPRDVPWLWLISGLQGRRDTLILRGYLAKPPRLDLELVDPVSWTGRLASKEVKGRNWESQSYQGLELIAPRGYSSLTRNAVEHLDPQRNKLTIKYRRFSLRKEAPHLELHIPFPDRTGIGATGFFESLQELARAVNDPELFN